VDIPIVFSGFERNESDVRNGLERMTDIEKERGLFAFSE